MYKILRTIYPYI